MQVLRHSPAVLALVTLAYACGSQETSRSIGGAGTSTGAASGMPGGGSTSVGASTSGGASTTGGTTATPGGAASTGGGQAASGAENTAGAAGSVGGAGDGGAPSTERCGGGDASGRFVECLDRGVIAVTSAKGAFVSWRLFGTDAADTSFNLYRQVGAAAPTLVCTKGPAAGTWCADPSPPAGASYFVRALNGGKEGAPSGASSLLTGDYLRIPLKAAREGSYVHLAWVGDLDGDGEYDVVVDRIAPGSPLVDAYKRDGTFMFRLDTGPLGVDQDNIEGGATTISNGHWDGLTVYDFDSNGRAEVAIKTARGFVFGDGIKLEHTNDADQFVSIADGTTGKELARAALPDDFKADGPLQCHFGVGYFDGVHPSVVTKCKNRVGSGSFNLVAATYDFDGSKLTRRWKYVRDSKGGADFHQIRVQDVDGDGKDELIDGGYVIDDDGKLLYSLGGAGVVHGDRFHITDIDPARPGLEGWGIQQDNANGLETYYYDAKTGEVLRKYSAASGAGADMGRGTLADLFPERPGLEYWSFNGMYSAAGELVVAEMNENVPWPNFSMQWDGDLGSELLDNNRVGDWNIEARSRNTYSWRRTFEGLVQARGAIPFYGDIFGDWREEALLETADHSELRIYTTTYETATRLYTLPHNPAYRNHLAVHGYKQSHLVDYYLGHGMATPPAPRIKLAPRP